MSDDNPVCPHCGQKMNKWETPEQVCWETPYHFVCFNDDCPYFIAGWNWMLEKYKQNTSYRYRIDPATGEAGPLPVWSKSALKNGIIEDDENGTENERD